MLQDFTNVQHPEHQGQWETLLEGAYLRAYFSALQTIMREDFLRFRFVVINHNARKGFPQLPIKGENTVLIWLSDETSSVPHAVSSDYKLILKSYWPYAHSVGNMHPFPLCGSSEVVKHAVIPFVDRTTNVFYSGNLNANRLGFYTALGKLPGAQFIDTIPYILRLAVWKYTKDRLLRFKRDFSNSFEKSSIRFTDGFRRGATPADFADLLANSKIALCPHGFTSAECIRHFEAMRLGCVIVSSSLPPNRFYQGSPIIQLKNWRALKETINDLLQSPHRMERISASMIDWWNKICSPKSMAQYTVDALAQP